ncbi:MAG: MerR family transcriptional regulator [Acidimicrobiales bacterium]
MAGAGRRQFQWEAHSRDRWHHVPPARLPNWARADLIKPSIAEAHGSGSRRRYSYRDLLELKVEKTLLDAGIRLESVREAFAFLRNQLGEDVASANLVINGANSVVISSGDELIELLQRGQGVLNILPMAGVKEEIDAAIVQLRLPLPGAQRAS